MPVFQMIQYKVIVGLICLGVAVADVRDIAARYQSTNTRFGPQSVSSGSFSNNVNGRQTGGTFIASNGQLVKQTFNTNGSPAFTSNNFGGNINRNHNRNAFGSYNTGGASNQYTTNTNHKRNFDTNSDFQCFSAWCQGLDLSQNPLQQKPQKIREKPLHQQQYTPNKQNHNTQTIFSNQVPQTYFNAFTQTSSSSNHVQNPPIPASHVPKIDTFRKFPTDSLPSGSFTANRIPCSGAGKVCAPKQFCSNGFVNENQLKSLNGKSNVSIRL